MSVKKEIQVTFTGEEVDTVNGALASYLDKLTRDKEIAESYQSKDSVPSEVIKWYDKQISLIATIGLKVDPI